MDLYVPFCLTLCYFLQTTTTEKGVTRSAVDYYFYQQVCVRYSYPDHCNNEP